jgi:hypothetical protein
MDVALAITYTLAYVSDLFLCSVLVYLTINFSTPISQDFVDAGKTLYNNQVPLINFLEDFTSLRLFIENRKKAEVSYRKITDSEKKCVSPMS